MEAMLCEQGRGVLADTAAGAVLPRLSWHRTWLPPGAYQRVSYARWVVPIRHRPEYAVVDQPRQALIEGDAGDAEPSVEVIELAHT